MNKIIKLLLYSLLIILVFSCEKEFDKKYERPSWLAGTVYDQLQAFSKLEDENASTKLFLKAIDTVGLSDKFRVSSWTLFVPNDAAMKKYLAANNLTSLAGLSIKQIEDIVLYHTVKYSFNDYQLFYPQGTHPDAALINAGLTWRFATQFSGNITKQLSTRDGVFYDVVGTAKLLPIFSKEYFANVVNADAAQSYNYFCPGTTFNGFNAANSQVVTKNVKCENGFIHVIDNVAGPLYNFDEIITFDPQYSIFSRLLSRFASFSVNQTATDNQPNKGDPDGDGYINTLYSKNYSNNLIVWPNSEQNTNNMEAYTALVPNDLALNEYLNNNILKFYTNIDSVPRLVALSIVNGHLTNTACWSQKLNTKRNGNGEFITIDPAKDVASAKLASNGLFYSLNKVQSPEIFSSVLGPIMLNPKYSVFLRLLESSGMVQTLKDLKTDYTIFVPTNQALRDSGIYVDANNVLYLTTSASNIVMNCIYKGKILDVSDKVFISTLNQSVIKVVDNENLQAGGNIEDDDYVPYSKVEYITPVKNGAVYEISKMFKKPKKNLGWYMTKDPRFSDFYRMLNLAGMMSTPNPNNSNEYTRYGFRDGFTGTIFVPQPPSLTSSFNTAISAEQFVRYLMIPKFKLMNYESAVPTPYLTSAKDPVLSTPYVPVYEQILVSYNPASKLITLSNKVFDQVTVGAGDDIIASDGIIHFIPGIIEFK